MSKSLTQSQEHAGSRLHDPNNCTGMGYYKANDHRGERFREVVARMVETEKHSVEELVELARRALKTSPSESPSLLLAAVDKTIGEIAPGEEPGAAAHRLSREWDNWAIEAGYKALRFYYEDSLDPAQFCVHEEPDHEDFVGVACDLMRILAGDA